MALDSPLIQQEVIAKTEVDSVAYKYEAGIKGARIDAASRVAWRDVSNNWQEYRFGGAPNTDPRRTARCTASADRPR